MRDLFVFVGFFLFQISLAQKSGYVIYQSINHPKPETNEPKSESQKFVDKIFEAEATFDYKLTFSDNQAIFSIVKIPLDKREIKSESSFFAYGVMKTSTLKYINLEEQRVYTQNMDDSSFYTYQDISKQNWNITNESKLINGRLCFKATLLQKSELLGKSREQLITAWFCPEIPISVGPGSVGGLPGIILILDSGGGAYVAKEVVFDDTIKVEKPKMKRVMSSEEYMKKVMQNY